MVNQNSYKGKTCPYCQFPIKQDSEAVQCRACQVPHHRECWEENGGCTTFGCQETSFSKPAGRIDISASSGPENEPATSLNGGINKFLAAALVMALLVIGLLGYNLLQGDDREATDPSERVEPEDSEGEADLAQRLEENYDPETIDVINEADYMIDYEHGTIPMSEIEIGARVVDPTWEWEFRTGSNYTRETGDKTKPVTWIVVAKDHYEGLEPHVTLLSKELIGRFPFDNSTHVHDKGYNHWGESGTNNANRGLRPWLNSSGNHSEEGFYQNFSKKFSQKVVTTTVPNREGGNGDSYTTEDRVFIPSTTELGDTEHEQTYRIGAVFPYFSGAGDEDRVAQLDAYYYRTRSPNSLLIYSTRSVYADGQFATSVASAAEACFSGVRPVLNLKSNFPVSEIPD